MIATNTYCYSSHNEKIFISPSLLHQQQQLQYTFFVPDIHNFLSNHYHLSHFN